MRKIQFIFVLFCALGFGTSYSQPLISAFNYQGELLDNGSPANGEYDFIFMAYDASTNGNLISTFSVNNIQVNNGLFNIPDLDFGENELLNNDEMWISIEIKKSSDPVSAFEVLSDRQKINYAPYAGKSFYSENANFATTSFQAGVAGGLSINGSNVDDILVFDGNQWSPQSNTWKQQGNVLSTVEGASPSQVSLGEPVPNFNVKFTVKSDVNGINSQFIGGDGIYNEYIESGVAKGYVGSVQDGTVTGTTSDDFEIGTSGFNQAGKLHLTINAVPKLTVSNNGSIGIGNTEPAGRLQVGANALFVSNINKVGVGTPIPTAKLQVNSASNQAEAMAVKIDNQTKFKVQSNGGVAIGRDTTPPTEGLYVHGDIQQNSASNGMLKYMARVNCLNSGSTVTRFHNGVNNGNITVTDLGTTGSCAVNFPSDINERYWQITAISSSGNHNANCHTVFANNQFICQRTLSGAFNNGEIMILVY